jgi:hypothetical protein
MVESRIQLWTDDTQAEFAILLKNSHYVIKTNEKTEFTKMIDESALMQGYNYDWKYTLAQWVNYHFGNQLLVKISETASILNPKPQQEQVLAKGITYLLPRPRPTSTITESGLVVKPKVLKCHFCNLKYCLDDERKQHEEFWHSDKISPR